MKNVVVCCDGTWDKPETIAPEDLSGSNVYKIWQMLVNDGVSQTTHYHPGVGTSGGIFEEIAGGIAGAGLDDNIKEAYGFIVNNYQPDDHVYMFGFSRGAYTARSLAGFIVNCGILKKENLAADPTLIDQAFEFYRDRTDATHPNSSAAQAFVAANSYPPAVYFIGVWDTVGDLGIPLKVFQVLDSNRYSFHDVQLSSIVPYAYHAVAVDEHRGLFPPTLWRLSDNAIANNITTQTIEQVWFAGAHGNVGGDYIAKDRGADFTPGLGDLTLLWMVNKAMPTGLIFNSNYADGLAPSPLDTLVNSNSGGWFALDGFHNTLRTININDKVNLNQSVDESVYDRIAAGIGYNPANVPPQV